MTIYHYDRMARLQEVIRCRLDYIVLRVNTWLHMGLAIPIHCFHVNGLIHFIRNPLPIYVFMAHWQPLAGSDEAILTNQDNLGYW
jgi:hypothetical protein